MIWLFILAAIAFVLGGMLSVRPSKAQQKVADIRANAMRSGIHVKLPVSLRFPDDIAKGRSPFYCKKLKENLLPDNYYCAFRDESRISDSRGDIAVGLKTKIDEALISAHPDIQGVYFADGLLGFSWLESSKSEVFTELCGRLEEVETLLGVYSEEKKIS